MYTPVIIIMAVIWLLLVLIYPIDVDEAMMFKYRKEDPGYIIMGITLWILFSSVIYTILNLGELL